LADPFVVEVRGATLTFTPSPGVVEQLESARVPREVVQVLIEGSMRKFTAVALGHLTMGSDAPPLFESLEEKLREAADAGQMAIQTGRELGELDSPQ
jgi:hypothetical protein